MTVVFLTLDEVLALHADQIARYGGRPGVRDIGLLQSALFRRRSSGGSSSTGRSSRWPPRTSSTWPRTTLLDGNKRTGLMAMLAFLGLNGRRLEVDPAELTLPVQGVAAGRFSKAEVAVFVRRHVRLR